MKHGMQIEIYCMIALLCALPTSVLAEIRFNSMNYMGGRIAFVVSGTGTMFTCTWIFSKRFRNLIEDKANNILKVGAAYNWNDLVNFCLSKNINGFENLIDIPGSVGATPIQNIGAYGVEVASLIESIDCYCLTEFKKINLTNSECNFVYRNSSLKNSKRLIYNINFITNKESNISINYQTIRDHIKENNINVNTAADVANIISKIRSKYSNCTPTCPPGRTKNQPTICKK